MSAWLTYCCRCGRTETVRCDEVGDDPEADLIAAIRDKGWTRDPAGCHCPDWPNCAEVPARNKVKPLKSPQPRRKP